MARIPDAEIERLKKEVGVERLVTGFGIELKRHGADLIEQPLLERLRFLGPAIRCLERWNQRVCCF